MLKLGINYCDCSGIMSTCKMKNEPLNQELCDYSDCKTNGCIHCRENMDGHCDNSEAQYDARSSAKKVFDIRDRSTYPKS